MPIFLNEIKYRPSEVYKSACVYRAPQNLLMYSELNVDGLIAWI